VAAGSEVAMNHPRILSERREKRGHEETPPCFPAAPKNRAGLLERLVHDAPQDGRSMAEESGRDPAVRAEASTLRWLPSRR
jgi:hypothetical protein